MSPAGLVINYTLDKADAHWNLSYSVSKAGFRVLLRSLTHGRAVQSPISGAAPKIATGEPEAPVGFPRGTPQTRTSDQPETAIASCAPLAMSPQTRNNLVIARSCSTYITKG